MKSLYRKTLAEIVKRPWLESDIKLKNKISSHLKSWVNDPNSTTKKFRKIAKKLTIEILFQGKGIMSPFEINKLDLDTNTQIGWIREVAIYLDQQLIMLARTVVPLNHFFFRMNFYKFIKTMSMGDWLFKSPLLIREPFDFFYQNKEQSLLQQELFARRSIFYQQHHRLLLTEIFLEF